ncbi:MAG: hypothetical protein JSW66_17555 [Phycisphaerales bacterium]|nr:MAG: hypothetical protein JSW66_17555 [Phycisphaerales bacterium]
MELSWVMKLRIAAAAAVGAVLIGIFAWPLSEPSQTSGAINQSGAAALLALALLAGFIGYFVSWPYGREIGILAVPFGLAVWAVRSGSMATLMQLNPTDAQRNAVVQSLRWQPVFWLVVVAAGFVGPLLCRKIVSKPRPAERGQGSKPNPGTYLSPIIAIAAAAVIAHLGIGILAQDVRLPDERLGFVSAQPALGQLAFGVLVSFGLAAFAVRKLLGVGYIWPIMASAFVTAFAMSTYAKNVPYLAQQWPAFFFSNAVASVLPAQMVAFGTLGSVAGYWMAARYDYWREHEM